MTLFGYQTPHGYQTALLPNLNDSPIYTPKHHNINATPLAQGAVLHMNGYSYIGKPYDYLIQLPNNQYIILPKHLFDTLYQEVPQVSPITANVNLTINDPLPDDTDNPPSTTKPIPPKKGVKPKK